MEKDRLEQLKSMVELNYEGRHDAPSLYFSHDDLNNTLGKKKMPMM